MLDRINKTNIIQKILEVQEREQVRNLNINMEGFLDKYNEIRKLFPEYKDMSREEVIENLIISYIKENKTKKEYLNKENIITGNPSYNI